MPNLRDSCVTRANLSGQVTFFLKMAFVGKSGKSEQHNSASVGKSGESAQHCSTNVSESGESSQHGSVNVVESGESAQHGLDRSF